MAGRNIALLSEAEQAKQEIEMNLRQIERLVAEIRRLMVVEE